MPTHVSCGTDGSARKETPEAENTHIPFKESESSNVSDPQVESPPVKKKRAQMQPSTVKKESPALLIASTIAILLSMFLSMTVVFLIKSHSRENSLQKQNEQLIEALTVEKDQLREYVSLGMNGALFHRFEEEKAWAEEIGRRDDAARQEAVEKGNIAADRPNAALPEPMVPLPRVPYWDQVSDAKTRMLRHAAKHGHINVLFNILTDVTTVPAPLVRQEQQDGEASSDREGLNPSSPQLFTVDDVTLRKEIPPFDGDLVKSEPLLHLAASSGNIDSAIYIIHTSNVLQRGIGAAMGTKTDKTYRQKMINLLVGEHQTPSSNDWNNDVEHIATLLDAEKDRQSSNTNRQATGLAGLLGAKKKPVLFSIDIGDDECNTPLQIAAKHGHLKFVEVLMSGRSDFSESKQMQMVELLRTTIEKTHVDLHPAVRNNKNKAASPTSSGTDFDSIAPLEMNHLVIRWKIPDIHHTNCDGATALHIAAESGNLEMVKLLIKMGARANLPFVPSPPEDGPDSIDALVSSGDKAKCLTRVGPSPLHYAAYVPNDSVGSDDDEPACASGDGGDARTCGVDATSKAK